MISALRQRVRQWNDRQPLAPYAAASLLGICLDRWIQPNGVYWWVGSLSAASFLIIASLKPKTGPRNAMIVMAAMVLLASLFGWRHHGQQTQYDSATIPSVLSVDPEPTILVGVVDESPRIEHPSVDPWGRLDDPVDVAEPQDKPWVTRLVASVETLRRGAVEQSHSGRVEVIVDSNVSDLQPGDRVRLFGQIRCFDAPNNPGVSDRRLWARTNNLHALMRVQSADDLEALPATESFGWLRMVHRVISRLSVHARQTIIGAVDHEEAGLALALVLGQRDLVDNRTNELLMTTGTAHLLSVSGLHLGIVVIMVRVISVLMNLSINRQLVFIALVTLLYIAITGGRPPVLRAAILVGTWLLSIVIARPQSPLSSLCLAAMLIAFWSPNEVFAIGTQLSFLAVGTLLTCSPRLRHGRTAAAEARELEQRFDDLFETTKPAWARWLRWSLGGLGNGLWYSGCVTLISLPLIWQEFHLVSPVSVVINVLLTPLMTIALSAGLGTAVAGWTFGWFSDSVAMIPGWLCSFTLSWMRKLVEVAGEIPMGHFWLPAPPVQCVVCFYVGLSLCLIMCPNRWRALTIFFGSIVWYVLSYWIATSPTPLPLGSVEATFVDVGHGTSVIMRTDEANVWLYDCGWMGNTEGSSWSIESTLWSMGVTRLRCVVLSHADNDHYNAFPGLAKRFRIDSVITPPGFLAAKEGTTLQPTLDAIDRYRIPVVPMHCDQPFLGSSDLPWFDDVVVLHPPAVPLDASDNANSLVLQVTARERCLFLPGDLEPPGTAILINRPRPAPGGVMMAPHHGSLRTDAESVLQWARPAETIVSGGRRAKSPEVALMLQAAGGGVHVTARDGAIRIRMNPQQPIEVRTWRKNPW